MREKRIARVYYRELFAAFALYTILLMVAISFGRPMADSLLRTAILASPMISFGAAIRAIARQVQRADEHIPVLCLSLGAVQLVRKTLGR